MSTPNERATALELAIKALSPMTVDVIVSQGEDGKVAEGPLFNAARVFETYISGPEPRGGLEFHDGAIETSDAVGFVQDPPCRRCGVRFTIHGDDRTSNNHPFEEQLSMPGVEAEAMKTPNEPKSNPRCAECDRPRSAAYHDPNAQGHGGHEFKPRSA